MNTQALVADQAETPANNSAAIVSVIERAAMNPDVDVSKMERLLDMQQRILDRSAKEAFNAAFAAMQPELPVIPKRGAIKNSSNRVQSTYGKWEDTDRLIRPVLHTHGFGLSFRTEEGDGCLYVTSVLAHRDGHSEQTTLRLPIDNSGSKNVVQGVGSSLSYGKRYTAGAILNLIYQDDPGDDDGQLAGRIAVERIGDAHLSNLRREIKDLDVNEAKFCRFLRVEALEDLPADRFADAVDALAAKRKDK